MCVCMYTCIYIHTKHIHMSHVYMFVFIYRHRGTEREREGDLKTEECHYAASF